MTTFSDLGTPFPLFQAPIDDASDFVGQGICGLCDAHSNVCFELGIGSEVIVTCPACSREVGLDADDRQNGTCPRCGTSVIFPAVPERLLCCFSCLRNGRAAITKDTELGMVSWEHASQGLTHGVPGLNRSDFELVPTESDWVRARVDGHLLVEMVRTPGYSTIQGERWKFCCQQPMAFVGSWSREEFAARASDGDGKALLALVLGEDVPGLWEDELHDVTGIYVFRCRACSRLAGHWDIG
jgi:uncharacterized protein CbrC (UPF0167 family)